MAATFVFITQLLWFTGVWSAIVYLVVWPWSRQFRISQRLSLWVVPQMFRILGLGLLVPALSPGVDDEFAVATSIGDSLTAGLALLAFVGLRRGWRQGRALAWACSVAGVADLLIAFPHAAYTQAASHLAAQWYVPVFAVPVMVVSHAACLITLLRTSSRRRRREAEQGAIEGLRWKIPDCHRRTYR